MSEHTGKSNLIERLLHMDFGPCKKMQAIKEIDAYFVTRNGVPETRATIKREEWEAARAALSAGQGEPVKVTDEMAYSFQRGISDGTLTAQDVEDIKAGLRSALANVYPPSALASAEQMREQCAEVCEKWAQAAERACPGEAENFRNLQTEIRAITLPHAPIAEPATQAATELRKELWRQLEQKKNDEWVVYKPEGAPYAGIRTRDGKTIAGTSSGLSISDAEAICAAMKDREFTHVLLKKITDLSKKVALIHTKAEPVPAQSSDELARCAAGRDGDCIHTQCPQLRDGEPAKSGRHCPLDTEQGKE